MVAAVESMAYARVQVAVGTKVSDDLSPNRNGESRT